MRFCSSLLILVACSEPAPIAGTIGSGTASPAASDEIDRGTFVWKVDTQTTSKETFSVRRSGDHLVLRSRNAALEDPKYNQTEGELETDLQYRPLRAAYRRVTPADGFEYRLGGSPLTLDVTRDDKNHPVHLVATGPLDVYIAGPGVLAMTALCKVTGDVILKTFGDEDSGGLDYVEAYRGAAVGTLQRIVVDSSDTDFELLCDGERLIGGGTAKYGSWFVREGREADLAALQAAARPPPKQWAHPVIEAERWNPLHTYLIDRKTLVTRDKRRRVNRLTAFDVATGSVIAHRDFRVPVGTHVMCEALTNNRLVCENSATGYIQVIDARTLADQVDLAPVVQKAVPNLRTDHWSIENVDGELIDLVIDDEHGVTIDLRTRTATPKPMKQSYRGVSDPTRCSSTLGHPIKIGNEIWTIDQQGPKAFLTRKVGKQDRPPLELAFYYPSLLECAPNGGGAYIMSYHEASSVLGSLAPDASVRWKLELGAHPQDLRVLGDTLILTTNTGSRRVLAIDTRTGKLLWTAEGPQPTR